MSLHESLCQKAIVAKRMGRVWKGVKQVVGRIMKIEAAYKHSGNFKFMNIYLFQYLIKYMLSARTKKGLSSPRL